jgi:uncharacterized lipoprotein YajG
MKNILYLLIFVVFIFPACGPKVIKLHIELGGGGSLLKQIEPLIFSVSNIEDKRSSKNLVGNHPIRAVITKRDAKDIIAQSIISELKRNGHKILNSELGGQSDFIIEGNINKFDYNWKTGYANVDCNATIEIELNIKSTSSNKIFTKRYTGNYYSSEFGGSFKQIRIVLNEALYNMVREFTTDKELFEYIQANKKNKVILIPANKHLTRHSTRQATILPNQTLKIRDILSFKSYGGRHRLRVNSPLAGDTVSNE